MARAAGAPPRGWRGGRRYSEVWLAAHRAGPDPDRPARPWLAGVLRNVSRTWRRNEARRVLRDRQFQDSLPNDAPGADATYERLELQRLLVDRMMALDRPLREVVVLRYFEGLIRERLRGSPTSPRGRCAGGSRPRSTGCARRWTSIMAAIAAAGWPRSA